MNHEVKYVRTKCNMIIIFSDLQQHSEFKQFGPVSAGFIDFDVDENGPTCKCYGESISLGLKADVELDTKLAKRFILNAQI